MTTAPLSIAVIGAGPSGLFFCHAIEYMMKQTGRAVSVTCFERSSQPGGVWRAADPDATKETTEMYDKLWTNGASHCTEFFDYTFDEHFGRPVSVYMKRQDLLEYILGRVTKHTPDFFEKYVQFSTDVEHVVYDDAQQRFNVTIKDRKTMQTEVRHFDKCAWACGENGKQKMPEAMVNIFKNGNYQGTLIHSADTAQLEENVRGKRILLVGGGYSAEDLALQAVKLGVEKVYVSCRYNSAEICYTENWPNDKVEVLRWQVPTKVTEKGNCIQFQEVEWSYGGYKIDSDEVETELRDIDTVILCTGYDVNLDMLDDSLRKGFPKSDFKVDECLEIPEGWKMPENTLSELTGDVELSDKVQYHLSYVHPDFYKGVLISNPNMMFVCPYGSHLPLLGCETYAWLLAGFATGWTELPTKDEMKRQNQSEALMMLGMPYFRYYMDENYCNAVNNLEDFWPEDGETPEKWDEVEYEEWVVSMKRLGQVMKEGKYPFSLGDYKELNENGKAFIKFGDLDYEHRANLKPSDWKTFRDVDDADKFFSVHTGTCAVPLKQRWLDMEAEEGKENR